MLRLQVQTQRAHEAEAASTDVLEGWDVLHDIHLMSHTNFTIDITCGVCKV